MEALLHERGWKALCTEELEVFRREFDSARVVMFLLTSGTVLDDDARSRFRSFVEKGGGFVGVHSATTTEPGWAWFDELVGARFVGHPEGTAEAVVTVVEAHPATRHLPSPWTHREEWYSFDRQPTDVPGTRVLLTVDEASYALPPELAMGTHPIAWCREVGRGRSLQTALGHDAETYENAEFREHLAGAVRWAAKLDES